jgi:hypothetical protein
LKQDSRGRVRVSRERREALLAEFDRSGLSGLKFAELVGMKYGTFATWVQRRRKEQATAADSPGQGSSGPVRLFEAIVEPRAETALPLAGEGLLIELPGGSRVRVGSPRQLPMAAELIGLVAQRERERC